MNDKKITFVVTADTKNADQNFKKLETEAKKLGLAMDGGGSKKAGSVAGGVGNANYALTNLGRVASDLPYGFIAIQNNLDPLIQSFIMLKKESGSTMGALSMLKNSLMGASGLFLAFQIVTSAITMYMLSNRGASKSVKDFKQDLESLEEALTDTKDSLSTYAKILAGIAIAPIPGLLKESLINLIVPEDLIEQQRKIEAYKKSMMSILSVAEKGGDLTKFTKGELTFVLQTLGKAQIDMKSGTTQLNANIQAMRNLREELKKFDPKDVKKLYAWRYEQPTAKPLTITPMRDLGEFMRVVPVPEKPEMSKFGLDERDIREHFKEFSIIADAAADTMRNAFGQAWRDIFGEANSLLEQFAQNVMSGLLSLFAGSVSGGIFGFLTALVTGGKPSTIILEVDGQNMGTYITKQLPVALNRNMRLKAL